MYSQIRNIGLISILCISILAVILISCDKDPVTTKPKQNVKSYIYLRDWQYDDGRMFDLGINGIDYQPGDIILDIKLYTSADTAAGDTTCNDSAIMYVDPNDIHNHNYINENSDAVEVCEIEPGSFYVQSQEHWLVFTKSFDGVQNKFLGAYLKIIKNGGDTVEIGNIESNPKILKLIKHKNPDPSFVSWNYAWRNVYYLKTHYIVLDSLEIDIFKGPTGSETSGTNSDMQESTPYIQILGLDRINSDSEFIPDGVVDVLTGIVEPDLGLLIMPDRRPFEPSFDFDSAALDPTVPEIYNYPYGDINVQNASKYYFKIYTQMDGRDTTL